MNARQLKCDPEEERLPDLQADGRVVAYTVMQLPLGSHLDHAPRLTGIRHPNGSREVEGTYLHTYDH